MPTVVARDLDEDPEQLTAECLTFLHYAEAKYALDNSTDEKQLKNYEDTKLFGFVKRHTYDLHIERLKRHLGDNNS